MQNLKNDFDKVISRLEAQKDNLSEHSAEITQRILDDYSQSLSRNKEDFDKSMSDVKYNM
jgi:gas vesicle protein